MIGVEVEAHPPSQVHALLNSLAVITGNAALLFAAADTVDDPTLIPLLESVGRHVEPLEAGLHDLAGDADGAINDIITEFCDSARTIAARWTRMTPAGRVALIKVLHRREIELTPLLVELLDAAAATTPTGTLRATPRPTTPTPPTVPLVAVPPTATLPKPPQSRGARSRSKPTAELAWAAWIAADLPASGAEFLLLLSAWMQGTAAQLLRGEGSPGSRTLRAADVEDRLRHHLTLLAHEHYPTYREALNEARLSVLHELRATRTSPA
jgi:hypothetical protein